MNDEFKIIETDRMTGWERYLDNMKTSPWTGTFTKEQADASVEWRRANITRRYGYTIVPVKPYMTDNEVARIRHVSRHGSHPMDDCGDVDCREAVTRQMHDDLVKKLAND
jgi:hypothetical protein